MSRKFITCSNCGKKIYEGEDVVFQDGIIYRCCSSACLANLMLNISSRTLNDEFMTSQEEEWETEENEKPDFEGIIKALHCFADSKDFSLLQCRGCVLETKGLCAENMSSDFANLLLSAFSFLQEENATIRKSRDKWKEIANVFDASIREYEKIMEADDK